MPSAIDPAFEISFVVALRLVKQAARTSYAGKHPHLRDAGADQLAIAVIERLRMDGWHISKPPTMLPIYRTHA